MCRVGELCHYCINPYLERFWMSYILMSNVGALVSKYKPIITAELQDFLLDSDDLTLKEFDLGIWFEWSFNHILHELYFIEVRNRVTSITFENIFRKIEPSYIEAFNCCLDRNISILRNLPHDLTAKALLSHETIVIVASPKIIF